MRKTDEGDLRFGGNRWLPLQLALASGLATEDSHCELSVVEAAAAILVIGVEEGPQLFLRIVHARFLEHALELRKVDCTGIHHVEVLEHLHEAGLFRHLRI